MSDKKPYLFTAEGSPVMLNDAYKGRSVFLIAGGPSFGDDNRFPKELLRQPGIITFGLNNSPKVFRPTLWTSVDDPGNFLASIWLDPLITKMVPVSSTSKRVLDSDSAKRNGTLFTPKEKWEWHPGTVADCPNVLFYKRNDHFQADKYLTEPTINWGNSKARGGNRSVMLAAIRLAYILGFRRIFLLGVDFEMSAENTYSFSQGRLPGSVSGNNSTYRALKERFELLKPHFKKYGLQVFNCNERSALKVFPHKTYKEAIDLVLQEEFKGIDTINENTEGLYDRRKRTGTEKTKKKKVVGPVSKRKYSEAERKEVKARLDAARKVLNDAKRDPSRAQEVPELRRAFRKIEDEKRWKNGEPIKWKLWEPDKAV